MKKILWVGLIWVGLSFSLLAVERGSVTLISPTGLESNMLVYDIGHRFYGDVGKDTLDTFFGSSSG